MKHGARPAGGGGVRAAAKTACGLGALRMVRDALWLVAFWSLAGCGALSLPNRDGGSEPPSDASVVRVDGGDTSDASVTRVDGGDTSDASVARVDGGDTSDAGSTRDGGEAGAGDAGRSFRATSLAVPATVGESVIAMAGRAGEVYALTNAELYRSTGGAFTKVPLDLSGSQVGGLFVADDGAVFVQAETTLSMCRSGCAAGGTAFTSFRPSTELWGQGLCGRSATDVYAVLVTGQNTGALWHYDGGTWRSVANDLGIKDARACVIDSQGTVIIAGRGGLAFHANGLTTVERPQLGDLTQNATDFQHWYGLSLLPDDTLWVSGQALRKLRRTPDGAWTFFDASRSNISWAIVALSATEVYAQGATATLERFDGVSWGTGPGLSSIKSAGSLYVASPDLIYVGGSNGSARPAVDRLSR